MRKGPSSQPPILLAHTRTHAHAPSMPLDLIRFLCLPSLNHAFMHINNPQSALSVRIIRNVSNAVPGPPATQHSTTQKQQIWEAHLHSISTVYGAFLCEVTYTSNVESFLSSCCLQRALKPNHTDGIRAVPAPPPEAAACRHYVCRRMCDTCKLARACVARACLNPQHYSANRGWPHPPQP